jgi:hypothetical protein
MAGHRMTSEPRDRCPATLVLNTTLVAALTPDGLHEPWMIEGAMDTEAFVWYITEQLAPTLRPGQIVVLDNLSVRQQPPAFARLWKPVTASSSSCRRIRLISPRSNRRFPRSKPSYADWELAPRRRSGRQWVWRSRRLLPLMRSPGSPMPATSCLLNLPERCSSPTVGVRW